MSIFVRNDGFVTNTSYDCKRALNKNNRRASRRLYGTPMISGPVYVNRMKEPMTKTFTPKPLEDEKQEKGIFKKIGALFAAAGATIAATFKEPVEADTCANEHYSESDIAFIKSLDDSANVYFTDYEAEAALRRAKEKENEAQKRAASASSESVKINPDAHLKAPAPSSTHIKHEVESAARKKLYEEEQSKLIEKIKSYAAFFPEDGAFKSISLNELAELDNTELLELLNDIETQIWKANLNGRKFNKKLWAETEEYLLFENRIYIDEFIDLLDMSGKEVIPFKNVRELSDWKNFKRGSTADFRNSGDVVHNANITTLKVALYKAYQAACEDGGKLDHDPALEFPNGSKTRLSRFIGKEWFDEISEPDAQGQDIRKPAFKPAKLKTA